MSAATANLLSEFEALRVEEKQEFVREIIQHLPPWDSVPLSDDVAAAAGEILAEEDASEFPDAAQQFGIGEPRGLIFLCSENIHSTPSQAACDA
jgi:hypothetical protein